MEFREAYVQILSQNAWTDPLLATAAMSSENRSSSAVRNLRSLFENKTTLDSSSPDSRGRSPSGIGGSDKENGSRPRSKVRASFVPVELAGMASVTADSQGTAGLRRGSFSEVDGDGALSELKRTVSEQQKHRLVPEGAVESAAGSVAATPNKKPGEGRLGHDMPPENPDKVVTGQQESSDMKPADPSNEKAVSGGDALPPVAEDLRSSTATAAKKPETKKPTTNGKPAMISTKATPKASSSAVKSPATQPKTPTSVKVSTSSNSASTSSPSLKAPAKKPSRSSLTAPTAASLARAGAAGSDKAPSTKTSPTTKPKPREVTKPVNLPSHLTAPTASSRAKHEPETAPPPKPREVTKPVNLPSHLTAPTASSRAKHEPETVPAPSTSRTTATPRPKATTNTKPAPRASLPARPASRDSTTRSRKSTAPADSSFLDRMTKPTTSSANRGADRHEVDRHSNSKAAAPAARAAPTKAKANGTTAATKTSADASVDPPAEPTAPTEAADEESTENPIQESVSNESYAGTPATGIQHSAITAGTHSAGEALTFAEEAAPVSTEPDAVPEAKEVALVSEQPEAGEAALVSEQREAEEAAYEPKGSETPIPQTNGEEPDASLEATPSAIGDEETIR